MGPVEWMEEPPDESERITKGSTSSSTGPFSNSSSSSRKTKVLHGGLKRSLLTGLRTRGKVKRAASPSDRDWFEIRIQLSPRAAASLVVFFSVLTRLIGDLIIWFIESS
jgi:hypothetical protein